MCAIFGVLDYKGKLTAAQRLHMVKSLSVAAEIRGTDATGIAYFQRDKLCIQKAPKPARKMKYRIPAEVQYIMGHTRMTTQGNPKQNQNNHPFAGQAGNQKFALAHNGVLTNDWELRFAENLPETEVETDSFVAVQLIEKEKKVTFLSIQKMAEKVQGSFTFTILDQKNNLYFVKGENPLMIYHYPDIGLYLYASTTEIWDNALFSLDVENVNHEVIQLKIGDILRIDNQGKQEVASFELIEHYSWFSPWTTFDLPIRKRKSTRSHATQQEYIQAVKTVAIFHGFEAEFIDGLISDGYTLDDIEDMIYNHRY